MKAIKENNILLAEFLGWKTDSKDRYITPFEEMDESGYMRYDYKKNNLQFDCDWNWLMLVVDKIESLGYCTQITRLNNITHSTYIFDCDFIEVKEKSKILSVYRACIEFIKWYNDSK